MTMHPARTLCGLMLVGSGFVCPQTSWAYPLSQSFQIITPTASLILIHCPEPTAIISWQIPRSFNAFYYSKSDEVAFSGLEVAGLPVASMPLFKAEVAVQGGVWRLYCSYFGEGLGLSVATGGSPSYEYCTFEDHSKVCINSAGNCVFMCDSQTPH